MTEATIRLEDCGAYAVITLDRPAQRNVLNRAAQLELQEVLRGCIGRQRAIILTGSAASFCAGIEEDAPPPAQAGHPATGVYSRQGHTWTETIETIRKHPAIFIAAVNGEASGEGVALINVCDLAIAAEDASIGMPEIGSATYPSVAGPSTQLRILRKHASWMLLTGRPIDGRTAARWGLVNASAPAGQLLGEARSVAERIAKFNPVTLDWSKKALDDVPGHVSDWTAALEYGRVITSVVQNQIGKENYTPDRF